MSRVPILADALIAGQPFGPKVCLNEDENSVYILLYFGTKDAEEAHEEELMSIVQSIAAE
jgi:hypothetical protein